MVGALSYYCDERKKRLDGKKRRFSGIKAFGSRVH